MSEARTCLRCGHSGTDVSITTVDLEHEAWLVGERVRVVEVELVKELRHVKEVTKVTVPERYGTEYRCRDRIACHDRWRSQQELERANEPVVAPAIEEEDDAWIA